MLKLHIPRRASGTRASVVRLALLFGTSILLSMLALLGINMPAASAHHTGCYLERSSTGAVTKVAHGSKALSWYVPAEGQGFKANRVYFNPQVRGHYHSCLFHGQGVTSPTTWAMKPGEYIYASVQYWDGVAKVWVNAGSKWFSNQVDLSSPAQKYSYRDPRNFTHARVTAWYWAGGVYSTNSQTITCKLGLPGQSSYACS